jgi:hypothetical protein
MKTGCTQIRNPKSNWDHRFQMRSPAFICVNLPFLSVAKNAFVFPLGGLGDLGGSILFSHFAGSVLAGV